MEFNINQAFEFNVMRKKRMVDKVARLTGEKIPAMLLKMIDVVEKYEGKIQRSKYTDKFMKIHELHNNLLIMFNLETDKEIVNKFKQIYSVANTCKAIALTDKIKQYMGAFVAPLPEYPTEEMQKNQTTVCLGLIRLSNFGNLGHPLLVI